ncbi:Ltp family lipoprotein [Acinetobacter sp. 99]|uniref:Ltp family lipoprotein n=1 Tax=Acinetobacter sp. 99 TaxID=3098765 RepID=UPI003008092F
MKTLFMWLGVIFFGLIIIGIFAGGGSKNAPSITSQSSTHSDDSEFYREAQDAAKEAMIAAAETDSAVATPAEESISLSGPQYHAARSAKQYLSMTGFSHKGLIQQLSSDYGDGYSISDATAAVNSLNVDWNEQATRSARQYLEMTGFSCKGLIEQLSSSAGDGYTVSQATYGAQQVGACG